MSTTPLLRDGRPNNSAHDVEGDSESAFFKEHSRWRVGENILLTLVSLTGIGLVIAVGLVYFHIGHSNHEAAANRNVILMISDGFGPASETYARQYYSEILANGAYDDVLPLDSILVGSSRTRSSNSLITDSAAGATAFACGIKTYNNAIGVDPDAEACGTIFESAHRMGYKTGMVVTSRVTHATPASFSAHVPHRSMEAEIALQQIGNYSIGRSVDLMFGGGRCEFLPQSKGSSCRMDDIDAYGLARDKFGWNIVHDINATAGAKLPLMGLFADDHMDFEIDRTSQPSLAEMTKQALDILTAKVNARKKNKHHRGFLLMVEGSRIDMAAHSNDPAGHVHEILAYQNAIKVVKKFVNKHPGTVLISVSDHETGGLTVGRQVTPEYPTYEWHPEFVAPVRHSTEYLTALWISYTGVDKETFLNETIIKQGLGIQDATPAEVQELLNFDPHDVFSAEQFMYALGDLVSKRALIGWSTHGHTSVDVNLYVYEGKNRGKIVDRLSGSNENIDIGKTIIDYLGLDLDSITKELRKAEFHEGMYKTSKEASGSIMRSPGRYGLHD